MADQMTMLKEKLATWFQSLTDSEQKLLKFASAFFIIFILYFVISSIQSGVSESERKLKQQQELNAWALQQIATIKSAAGGKKTQNSGSLTQVINTTSRKFNINIARLQPQKNDLVKVGLDDIGFNRLLQWLEELQSKHGVVVESIDFAAADEQGKVKVRRLDLGRG